jgi:carbamoyl-phosphate synthase large subunit
VNLLFSCIGRRGYIADYFRPHLVASDRIIGTGNTRWTSGFQSCDAAFLLPDIDDDGYVPAVLDLCERERVDAVLSFSDLDVRKLADARDAFVDRGIAPLFPTRDVAEIASDKYRTYQYLTEHGIPTPKTVTTLTEAMQFDFPMYVKDRHGSASQRVFRARDWHELDFFFSYAPDMIVQEEIPGQELNIQLCIDFDGHPVGICTLEKRAMRQGETDQAETFRDSEVTAFGLRLGEVLGATGPVDVDVMRRDDGTLVVLEANTRFGGAYPIAHLAGADFPKQLLELVVDGKVSETNFDFDEQVVMMKRLEITGGPSERFFRDVVGIGQ